MNRSESFLNALMVPVTAALVFLLLLTLLGWRRADVEVAGDLPGGAVLGTHPAAEQARQYFGWPAVVAWRPLTNAQNPFFTTAIQPRAPAPPPTTPPATRKVDVTYRGFFQTSAKVRRAVIQVADKQVLAGRGDSVLSDFVADEIELGHLGLTNAAGQTVKLEFRKTQPIEVPAK